MKILLLGEYSNVHWTLAEGLRALGHTVCVASNGDFWKNYKRDISLERTLGSKISTLSFYAKLAFALPRFRGYDIVQIINPMFLEMKAEKLFRIYDYLRKHNGKVFMGAFGMDYYWVSECREHKPLRYSDFNFGDDLRTDSVAMREVYDWVGTSKQSLNEYIAKDCNGIIAGLYEYYVCYNRLYFKKLEFIPFPINLEQVVRTAPVVKDKVKFFIGISKERSVYKGTDIMLRAVKRICHDFPNDCELRIAESVPFEEYQKMMNSSHVILDQLYSYTPAMNALLAMGKGLVIVGGGEEENYAILGEKKLRPIINVLPDEEDVYDKLKRLVMNKSEIKRLSDESRLYIEKYHNHISVAQKYLSFWSEK